MIPHTPPLPVTPHPLALASQAHLVEEEILSSATCFAADEVLRLPPRLPGQGLHQSLIDVARAQDETAKRAERRKAKEARRRAREAAAAATAEAGDDGANNNEGGAGGGPAEDAVELSDDDDDDNENGEETNNAENGGGGGGMGVGIDGGEAATAAAAAYGDEPWLETAAEVLERNHDTGSGGGVPEWERVPTAREEGRAHDVVVTGLPLSGKSTLARALGAKYSLPALTVDGAVRGALRLRNKLGARVREALHWFTAKEEVRCIVFLVRWESESRPLDTREGHKTSAKSLKLDARSSRNKTPLTGLC